ncbi:MAG TPA: C2 family cysteine protease [Leptolyngbyaceae cyanobacterium]
MAVDKAGNTFSKSKNLTFDSKIQTFSDWVGASDSEDFYRFSLSSRSSLNIVVDGLSANADLQLIEDKNGNSSIDKNDVIASSTKSGNASESILETLNAGNYFIKVYSKSGDTKYNLKFFQNFSPSSLDFQLNKDTLKATDTLAINSASVSDNNGTDDIMKVDFRIKKPDGNYIDVADAKVFTADSSNKNRASFSYSLSLKSLSLEAGKYTLEGKAYDESGATSNTVSRTFTVTKADTSQDWFSQNLSDQKIINLARSLASDGKLSRQDMLDIFRDAQDNSAIDANEVQDMRALVASSTPFKMEDHVKWLSSQVANGASVGLSANNFESNLVGRWFLGTVAPTSEYNGKKIIYTEAKGNLFGSSNKARIGDIDQGRLNNCTFLAALGSTFSRQSDDGGNASSSVIDSMIIDNGDDTYTVRFYSGTYYAPGEAQYVTVDRRIPTSISAQTNNGVLWVALVEKAYAQWREWRDGSPGYDIIGNGGTVASPLSFITGRQTTNYSIKKISFSTLETSLKAGKAIVTSRTGKDTSYILGSHAYSVTNAYTSSNGQQRVIVRNPWGVDGKAKSGANDGFIDLSYEEFIKSFNVGVSIS